MSKELRDFDKGVQRAQREIERARGGPHVIVTRGLARVCGLDYLAIRPSDYEPNTWIEGECVVCHDITSVHRVSWAEIDEYVAE